MSQREFLRMRQQINIYKDKSSCFAVHHQPPYYILSTEVWLMSYVEFYLPVRINKRKVKVKRSADLNHPLKTFSNYSVLNCFASGTRNTHEPLCISYIRNLTYTNRNVIKLCIIKMGSKLVFWVKWFRSNWSVERVKKIIIRQTMEWSCCSLNLATEAKIISIFRMMWHFEDTLPQTKYWDNNAHNK